MARPIEFKTSVATYLAGLDPSAKSGKELQRLVGRDKPAGQHHMRYGPADMRALQYRNAGMEPPESGDLPLGAQKSVPLIVTRMTKGGVGKTSVSVNIAATFAMMGYRCLFIDADPQSSASNLLGVETAAYGTNITHIGNFLQKSTNAPDVDLDSAIRHIYAGGFLDLIPSDITLAETDAAMVTALSSHTRAELFLSRNNAYLSSKYDVIVVDTAPGTTPIGLAFTYASKQSGRILTVVEPEGSCLRALDSLASNLAEIKALTNVDIGMEVVINKYHLSLKHVRESMGFLYANYSNMLNESIIPSYSGFPKQITTGANATATAPLVELEPSSIGSKAIMDITKSLVKSYGITVPGLSVQG